MTRFRHACRLATLLLLAGYAGAADVYGQRFAEPRIYFTQANLNKGGSVTALRGQENFLRLYVPAVVKDTPLDPAALTFTVELPAGLTILPDVGEPLSVAPAGAGIRVSGRLDPDKVRLRCVNNTWGIERVVWFAIDPAAPAESPITVSLAHQGRETFADRAKLVLRPELVAPTPVDPRRFRLWLHYGPHLRGQEWDALADYLRRAGINTVQVMAPKADMMTAMRERGFYVIAQRGGSYEKVYRELAEALEQGQAWFDQADADNIRQVADCADAVLWDFEPRPADIPDQPKLLALFRQRTGVDADRATIQAKHLDRWVPFAQDVYAELTRNWAAWTRSLNPKLETILTEGRCNVFDPSGQIDYRRVAGDVTFCDPMNYSGAGAVAGLRQWLAAAPQARFTGCQNVALHSYATVFASADTIMLQTLTAALLGNAGTSVYPGPAMDAENFIAWNRVMTFLGANQEVIWAGQRGPRELLLTLTPKEDRRIQLGNGKTIRNLYPDWATDAVTGTYRAADGQSYLVAIANWNATEPCFAKIELPSAGAGWLALDDEQREAVPLRDGALLVRTPPQDYRGFRLVRGAAPDGYRTTDRTAELAAWLGTGGEPAAESKYLGYDDIDGDNAFEYVVTTPAQTVWLDQGGRIVRWRTGETTLTTHPLGLGRDMIWQPQSEQGNAAMDAPMKLTERSAGADCVELTFARSVRLPGVGGQSSLALEKRYQLALNRADVGVEVTATYNSLAAEAIDFSYRVHNHLAGAGAPWVDDGANLTEFPAGETFSVPNAGLSEAHRSLVYGGCPVKEPLACRRFGTWNPATRALLTIVPRAPESLLQLLRWASRSGDAATVEWMYRPQRLAGAASWTTAYDLSLRGQVTKLDRGRVDEAAPRAMAASGESGRLLFHVDFAAGADAVTAGGQTAATVTGPAVYEPTPTGRGLRVADGTSVAWLPEGNLDPARGKLFVRFKPLWDGSDQVTHFLLRIRPTAGLIYVGKLDDGRFLINLLDQGGKQHYPWALARHWRAGDWHEATMTWDAALGRITLFLDGQKAAAHEGQPWPMASFDNRRQDCRILIPDSAQAVIDELKIWDR